mmetsp:Transcript_29706/g.45446  ORF Transcript_29706/g.45446 Transcript_29706/m.45446 type:complete len:425 (-) Transcript_29706:196-1470(-)
MHPSLENFSTIIQQSKGKVPEDLADCIDAIASKAISEAIKEMTTEAREFLSYELDDDKHTIEQVKAIIEFFPDSLSQLDGGLLPIQEIVVMNGYFSDARRDSFIPLMAKEGCRLGVGGEGNRGGLLSVMDSDDSLNTIQWLASKTSTEQICSVDNDRNRAQVLKDLRSMDLLKKTDIEEYGLLQELFSLRCKHRFEFFSNWDPGALGPRDSQLRIPIHSALGLTHQNMREESFEMVLKVGMKYFPEHLGFLFCKENKITPCKKAFDTIGVGPAMNIIRRCIPLSDNYPILHHAIKYAPDLANDIAQFYPDAAFLRNNDGHTISQFECYISLRRGRKTFQKQSLFFIRAKDDKVNRQDPKTGLYPFMSAAVGNKSDLSAVFYLLSRNPKLVGLDGNEKKKAKGFDAEKKNKRKRQRNKRKRQQND